MFKNKKFVLIILVISLILIMGLVGTYAWYVWSTKDDDITKIATNVGVATVVYDDGADITGVELLPVADKNEGIVKDISVRTNYKDTNAELLFNLYLDINTLAEELKHESFKYELWRDGEEEAIVSGNFTQTFLDENLVACETNNTNHIILLENETITKDGAIYTLYIWLDGNSELPYEMAGKDFSFALHADGQNAMIVESITPDTSNMTSGTLAYNIVNTYNSSTDKTSVTNSSVKYYYDTKNNLMSDIDGNVRYYGSDPNNYIYFNCNDYTYQTADTCEVWRIIGVFDGKVKIVRDTIGTLTWDILEDESYSNNWHTSTINSLLNNSYYNNVDTTYNNFSTTSGVTSVDILFNTDGIGIKNDETRSLMSESTWYLGGYNSASIYADDIYRYERSDKKCSSCTYNTTWTGNVGLIYPSDYAYASDLSLCSNTLRTYEDNSNCLNTNWMFRDDIEFGIWTMTPNSGNATNVWRVFQTGYIDGANATRLKREIHPVIYLDEDVVNYAGNGSSSSPYKITFKTEITSLEYGNAVESITNYYLNNKVGIVSNNSIEYQYSQSVNLMNDRLGGTTTDYDAGNIRYYGANPNNYVDIGDRDSSGNVILYRIIGLFNDMELSDGTTGDLIKVIRADSIGTYAWNESGSNDWSNATLNTNLNGSYYYTKLSQTVQNKIETVVWNLGGSDDPAVYSNEMYIEERGTTVYSGHATEWTGKVALMYLSDYGYATNFKSCSQDLWSYDSSDNSYGCRTNDWLYNGNYGTEYYEWLLNPWTWDSISVHYVDSKGHVTDNNDLYVDSENVVRPVFYLNSSLNITSGSGTSTDPYVIG